MTTASEKSIGGESWENLQTKVRNPSFNLTEFIEPLSLEDKTKICELLKNECTKTLRPMPQTVATATAQQKADSGPSVDEIPPYFRELLLPLAHKLKPAHQMTDV